MNIECEGQGLPSSAPVAAMAAATTAPVDTTVEKGCEHLLLRVTAGQTAAPALATLSGDHGGGDVDSERQEPDREVALNAAVQSLAQEFPQRFNGMQLEHKGICLHATEYFGPGWSHSVEVPQWAKRTGTGEVARPQYA